MQEKPDPWQRLSAIASLIAALTLLLIALTLLLILLSGVARAAQPTADAMLLADRDCQKLPPQDQLYTFYGWLSQPDPVQRWVTATAFAGQLNGLSLGRRIVTPLFVLSDGHIRTLDQLGANPEEWTQTVLMRGDLRFYRQPRKQWDKLGDPSLEHLFHAWSYPSKELGWIKGHAPWLIEPLGVKPDMWPQYRDALKRLLAATGSQVPIIDARNYVWQVAIDFDRPAGYYSWLGIVDRKSFEKLVRLQAGITPLREAIEVSGVAEQPRAVDRYGRGDGTWYTYDQVNGRGQFNKNPLLQLDRKKLLADAIEGMGPLDNDWWAWVLIKIADDSVQQSAPDGVGYHKWTASNDGKIHVNLACHACHDREPGRGGLQPFVPFFRNQWAEPGPLALPLQLKEDYRLAEEYLVPLDPRAELDRQRFASAVYQATRLTPQQYARNLYDTFHSWDKPLTLDDVAWEHGVDAEAFVRGLQAALVKHGRIDNINGNWTQPKVRRRTIGRDQVAESYGLAELYLRGLAAWPPSETKQIRVK